MRMTQTALPASDVSTGSWTPTPVWPNIMVPSPPDLQYVTSSANPAGDAFVVNLNPLAWPGSGSQIVSVRLKATASNGPNVSVILLQSGTAIAAWNIPAPSTSFADYSFTLTPAQGALITDYTQLRLEVVAGGPTVACCPNSLPYALTLSLSGVTHFASSYPLTWDAPNLRWDIGLSVGGGAQVIKLFCSGTTTPGGWILQEYCNGVRQYHAVASSGSCSPFSLTFPTAGSGFFKSGASCTINDSPTSITVTQ
jgi:hypothetical protein